MKIQLKIRKIQAILYTVVLFCLFPSLGHAQGIPNPIPADNLLEFIALLVTSLRNVGLVVSVCFIIYSGFLFVTARGNDGQITKAKTNFFWTVIGVAILLGASVVVDIVTGAVGSINSTP